MVGRRPVGSSACEPCRLGWAVAVGTWLRLGLSLGEPPDTLRDLPWGFHIKEEKVVKGLLLVFPITTESHLKEHLW